MKTRISLSAFILCICVFVTSVLGGFGAEAEETKNALWLRYIHAYLEDGFYREPEDTERFLLYMESQIELLDEIMKDESDDWLVYQEMSYLLGALDSISQYEPAAKGLYERYEGLLSRYDEFQETMSGYLEKETLSSIEQRDEPALLNSFRLFDYALEKDRDEDAIPALRAAIARCDNDQLMFFIRNCLMKCHIGFYEYEKMMVLQPFGKSDAYSELYSDSTVCHDFSAFILLADALLEKGASHDTTEMLIQRACEANAFLAYSAYSQGDIDSLNVSLRKAWVYSEMASNRNVSTAASLYFIHLYALSREMDGSASKSDYEAVINELFAWRATQSLYYGGFAFDEMVEDCRNKWKAL